MATKEFPLEIKTVTEDEDKIIKKYYKDFIRPFVRIGPDGFLGTAGLGDRVADIYNLQVKPDDVWVTSFSRSGTTWLQELVWLVANNIDFETAAAVSVSKRYAYVEFPTQNSEVDKPTSVEFRKKATFEDYRTMHNLPSPRYIKSHLPLSHLPPNLIDTAKVLYVARDPRDVLVSWHFAHKLFGYFDDEVTISEFWELFKKDLLMHMPLLPHVKEAWDKRNNPNLLFLFYEDMQKDLLGVINKVCDFLGREYSTEQKQQLVQYLGFENMKKKTTFGRPGVTNDDEELSFLRKGKSGKWTQYFDEKMMKEADEYMADQLRKTGIRFPHIGDEL